jgi:hypothetical protein
VRYRAHSSWAWSDGKQDWADRVSAGDGDNKGVSGGSGDRDRLVGKFRGINTEGVIGGVRRGGLGMNGNCQRASCRLAKAGL